MQAIRADKEVIEGEWVVIDAASASQLTASVLSVDEEKSSMWSMLQETNLDL